MNYNREHITSGAPCWCGPNFIKNDDGSQIVVHRQLPPCLDCETIGKKAEELLESRAVLAVENAALREALTRTLNDLRTGFVRCRRCGDQETLSDTDMVYVVREALDTKPSHSSAVALAQAEVVKEAVACYMNSDFVGSNTCFTGLSDALAKLEAAKEGKP